MSTPVHTGGCQCGAIRYALDAEPDNASICHCRMCQKAFGSFYAPLAGIDRQHFRVTKGEIAVFKSSALAERGFCRDCGTPLTFRYLDNPEINIAIGAFDEPYRVKPTQQHGIEARIPWLDELAGLPGQTTDNDDGAAKVAAIRASSRQHPDHD